MISRLLWTGLLILGPVTAALAQPSNAWSVIDAPTPGPSEAIGFYSHGCLTGGVALPFDGPGYQVTRISRKRYFGHPNTVDYVQKLGLRMAAAGLPVFYVGDMAQPRGGPLPFGHISHQIGMDVDIWFTLAPKPDLAPAERENPALPSMLLPHSRQIDPQQFSRKQVLFLRLAADDPRVDRIFVNPAIKSALCHGFGGATTPDRAWLHKLSVWWGHDDHFHVRLLCPAGSPDCEPQKPVEAGDGCTPDLDHWGEAVTSAPPPPTMSPPPPPPSPHMPNRCITVLAQHKN